MKRTFFILKTVCITTISLLSVACSQVEKHAQQRLDNARSLYNEGNYKAAKEEIDSMKALYPKAFEQIKASFLLVDSIRVKENEQAITTCDSLITAYNPVIDSMKQYFVYHRNKEYQESGFYIPKEGYTGDLLSATTLRAGVDEKDGQIYIESVFIGKQLHNKVRVSTQDGAFAESDTAADFRFSNLGKQYEVIRYTSKNENGVIPFIAGNRNKPITVTLSGNSKSSYTLSNPAKTAISKAYELSVMMMQQDSLKTEKEKAQFRLQHLNNKPSERTPAELTED